MKVLKGLFKGILALFLAMLIFWTFMLGLLQTETGQEWALNQLKEYVVRKTGVRYEVGSFKFSFPLNLELKEITLAQENSLPIAAIQHFELCCSYTNLLKGRLVFSDFHASGIHIFHLPAGSESAADKVSKPWDAPLLPFYIKFGRIDLQNIRFSPEALSSLALHPDLKAIVEATSFDLRGMISSNPFRSAMIAHLQINTKSDNPLITPVNIGIDAQNHQLSFSFHLNQLPLQLFHSEYAKGIMGNLALYASGQVEDWQNLTRKTDHPTSSIEGHFKLTLEPQSEETTLLARFVDQQLTLRSRYLLKSTGEIELIDFKAQIGTS